MLTSTLLSLAAVLSQLGAVPPPQTYSVCADAFVFSSVARRYGSCAANSCFSSRLRASKTASTIVRGSGVAATVWGFGHGLKRGANKSWLGLSAVLRELEQEWRFGDSSPMKRVGDILCGEHDNRPDKSSGGEPRPNMSSGGSGISAIHSSCKPQTTTPLARRGERGTVKQNLKITNATAA